MEVYDNPDVIYKYKYASDNRSVIDKVLVYWWRIAIKAVPRNVSANMISMLGNLGSLGALLVLAAFGPRYGRSHTWIFWIAALGIMLYHTLDCLDGIQARRIGASGPLGEFVDHWFDAMNVFFLPLGGVVAFPIVSPHWAVPVIVFSVLGDWMTLREVTKTGLLRFSWFSSEEGIVIYILFLLSVPILGYDFWASPMPFIPLEPIKIIYIMLLIAHAGIVGKTLFVLRFDGIWNLLMELLCILPFAAWIFVGQHYGAPRWTMIFGLLCIGFTGTRHSGDLLRKRLFGLRYPAWYPDLLAGSVLTALITIAAALWSLPLWVYLMPMVYMAVDLIAALVLQFKRSIARVRTCLGYGLFYVPPAATNQG